jgi:hypothetical protein
MGEKNMLKNENKTESVNFMLGSGIFFLPYIFSWFLLRKNHSYSKTAKIISFSWMLLVLLVIFVPKPPPTPEQIESSAIQNQKNADTAKTPNRNPLESLQSSYMGSISETVAKDMIDQYNMVKRSGDVMQSCLRAGMVAEAYLQGKNEEKWKEWKALAKPDCKRAGMPM